MVPSGQSSFTGEEPASSNNSGGSVWKGQSWYPVLLGMLFDYPRQLPRNRDTFQIIGDSKGGPGGAMAPPPKK